MTIQWSLFSWAVGGTGWGSLVSGSLHDDHWLLPCCWNQQHEQRWYTWSVPAESCKLGALRPYRFTKAIASKLAYLNLLDANQQGCIQIFMPWPWKSSIVTYHTLYIYLVWHVNRRSEEATNRDTNDTIEEFNVTRKLSWLLSA